MKTDVPRSRDMATIMDASGEVHILPDDCDRARQARVAIRKIKRTNEGQLVVEYIAPEGDSSDIRLDDKSMGPLLSFLKSEKVD